MYEDREVVGTAVDILMSIADFHCSILRDYILQDTESQSEVSNLQCVESVIPEITESQVSINLLTMCVEFLFICRIISS